MTVFCDGGGGAAAGGGQGHSTRLIYVSSPEIFDKYSPEQSTYSGTHYMNFKKIFFLKFKDIYAPTFIQPGKKSKEAKVYMLKVQDRFSRTNIHISHVFVSLCISF